MALLNTGIETHPAGTVNPNTIINGNWSTIDTILTNLKTVNVPFLKQTPTETTEILVFKSGHGGKIKKIEARMDLADVVATVMINSNPVTGMVDIPITTIGVTATATELNTFVAGDTISLAISFVGIDPLNLIVNLICERDL